MGVREIAASFEHTCDGCGAVETRASNSRPPHWTGLHISADAYDYQGAAVADASVTRVLCPDCSSVVHKAVNAAIDERRGTKTTGAA